MCVIASIFNFYFIPYYVLLLLQYSIFMLFLIMRCYCFNTRNCFSQFAITKKISVMLSAAEQRTKVPYTLVTLLRHWLNQKWSPPPLDFVYYEKINTFLKFKLIFIFCYLELKTSWVSILYQNIYLNILIFYTNTSKWMWNRRSGKKNTMNDNA